MPADSSYVEAEEEMEVGGSGNPFLSFNSSYVDVEEKVRVEVGGGGGPFLPVDSSYVEAEGEEEGLEAATFDNRSGKRRWEWRKTEAVTLSCPSTAGGWKRLPPDSSDVEVEAEAEAEAVVKVEAEAVASGDPFLLLADSPSKIAFSIALGSPE